MKSIFTAAAAASLIYIMSVSCSSDGLGRRRPGLDDNGGNNISLVENPNWTVKYKGRSVTIEDEATFVEDVVLVNSTDAKKYYLDVISRADLNSKHNGNIESFVNASLKKLREQIQASGSTYDKTLSSGNSSAAFLRLDNGGGSWIAVAYGVTGTGALTKDYSSLNFTTKEVEMQKGENLPIKYTGRKPDTQEDVFIVEAKTKTTYYVDVVYDGFVADKFNGDIYKFFNSMLDELSKQLKEDEKDFSRLIYRGETTLLFERLRAGDWVAYAYGVDNYGYLTGEYSELKFNIKEENASEEFNKWLGKWALSGKAPVYDNSGNKVDEKDVTFNIEISKAEANVAYIISGWETMEEEAKKNTEKMKFEAEFNRGTGNLEFSYYDFGPWTGTDNKRYATILAGLYIENGKERVFLDKAKFSKAVLSGDGKKAQATGLSHTDNGGSFEFKGMCYIDIQLNDKNEFAKDKNGNYIINGYSKYIPYYPYDMVYKGSLGKSVSGDIKAKEEAPARKLRPAVRNSERTEKAHGQVKARRHAFEKTESLRRSDLKEVNINTRQSSIKTGLRK